MTDDERAQYTAWLDGLDQGETPTLKDYRRWLAYDDNLPWRPPSGQVVALLEDALDEVDAQTQHAESVQRQFEGSVREVVELATRIHDIRVVVQRPGWLAAATARSQVWDIVNRPFPPKD